MANRPGAGWHLIAAAGVVIFDFIRAKRRASLMQLVFSPEVNQQLASVVKLEKFGTLLFMAVHGLVLLCSLFQQRFGLKGFYHRINWAGITYKISGRQKVIVESRPDSSDNT